MSQVDHVRSVGPLRHARRTQFRHDRQIGHELYAFKPEFIKTDDIKAPLPGGLALLGLGLVGLVSMRRPARRAV